MTARKEASPDAVIAFKQLGHPHGVAVPRQNALELEQALPAIQPIPLEDAVQRIEERLVIDQPGSLFAHLLVVVESVEGAHGRAVERDGRQIEGQGNLWLGQGRERTRIFVVLTLHEDAAGKVAALGNAIDPRHGVFLVRTGFGERDKLLQPDELGAIDSGCGGKRSAASAPPPR